MKDFSELLDKKTDELAQEINDSVLVNCFRFGASWVIEPRDDENQYINFFVTERTENNMLYYEKGKEWAKSIFH